MNRSRPAFSRSIHRSAFARVLALGLCACQSRAPRPDPARDIAAAVGLAAPLEVRVEGLDSSAESPAQLALTDALTRALCSSPDVQAALARVQVAVAEADQARLFANPLVSLVVRFPESGGRADVELGVAEDLLQLFRRPRRIGAADKRLQRAVADAVTASLDVVADLRERYANVQALDELTPLLRERQATVARLTELARARLEAGESSRLDVLALEAEAADLEIEIGQREAERTEERLALARRIGQPSLPAEWHLEGWSSPAVELPEAAWIRSALERRPEIAARRWELEALGDERALAGTMWLDGASVGVDAESDDGDWSVGPSATVPLPLFDGGGARRDRARAEVLAARAELLGVQRTVVEEVRRAHASLRAARANLDRVRTRLIPLQQERRAQVEAVYLAGEADVTAVLLAEQDLQESQAKLVDLERETARALVRLERSVGGSGVVDDVGVESVTVEQERGEP